MHDTDSKAYVVQAGQRHQLEVPGVPRVEKLRRRQPRVRHHERPEAPLSGTITSAYESMLNLSRSFRCQWRGPGSHRLWRRCSMLMAAASPHVSTGLASEQESCVQEPDCAATHNHITHGFCFMCRQRTQVFLLDYEQAHPEDITGDSCAICGGGEDVADDWISCDVRSDPTSGLACPATAGRLAVHTMCNARQLPSG